MSAADDQFLDIQAAAGPAGWTVSMECISGVDTAVLVRRQERASVSVDQKLIWLSSLGMGDFSRAQWDHMSKRERRARVLADADLAAVQRFVDELPHW